MTAPRIDDCIVRPLRFTDDIEAMRGFLELLGMAPRVESTRGGWLTMVSGAGMIALHEAATSTFGNSAGDTSLAFEGADLEALAGRLTDAGWDDATIWDEAYGRVLSVTDPGGIELWVDGYEDDYGFRIHGPERDGRWSVMPVRSTVVVEEYARFLGQFGLPDAGGDEPADGPTLGGHVGLVRLESGPEAVRLGFATAEPLHDAAARLREAGHDPTVEGRRITVVDPDGQPVVVDARS
jgi:hypothetical protein